MPLAHPRSLTCFLPPTLLTNVARRGSNDQRRRALRAIEADHSFRSARQGLADGLRAERPLRRLRQIAEPVWLRSLDTTAQRTVYDCHDSQQLPGQVVRREGDPPTGTPAVDEAYDHLGATFDFYLDIYDRRSVDDAGLPLDGSVSYGHDYDNAFWDGRRMVFGDGDDDLFRRFTIPVDVVAHELTHGVTDHEAGLIYWGQSGALNESVSDVFGSLVKQYEADQKAADADWLIGEGLFTDKVNGVALRSMAAPGTAYDDPVLGKDTQPATMADYDHTFSDNAGVHANSGIPNHAFYLAATNLGGYAWERAGLIWYTVLTGPLLPRTAQFQTFANLTVLAATSLFPDSADEADAVSAAWAEVGIRVPSASWSRGRWRER